MRLSAANLHGNTRAILVGVSLLLMAYSAAELRQLGVDRDELLAAERQTVAQSPYLAEQVLIGLSLLGYSEHELTQLLRHERQQALLGEQQACHQQRHARLAVSLDPASHASRRDQRVQLAYLQPTLTSGSPPHIL